MSDVNTLNTEPPLTLQASWFLEMLCSLALDMHGCSPRMRRATTARYGRRPWCLLGASPRTKDPELGSNVTVPAPQPRPNVGVHFFFTVSQLKPTATSLSPIYRHPGQECTQKTTGEQGN